MRKLTIFEYVSLDGVMQSPGSPEEDPSGGFTRGGWVGPYLDESVMQAGLGGMATSGGLLLGPG